MDATRSLDSLRTLGRRNTAAVRAGWRLLGALMLVGAGASANAQAPGADIAGLPQGCADLSGEYENRASAGSRGDIYLSNLLGLSPGVTRVVLAGEEAGMVLTAHLYTSGAQQVFFAWSDFGCNGLARVYRYTKSNLALSRYEGRSIGGSMDGQVAMEKTRDGSLLVRRSWSRDWEAPVFWGFWRYDDAGEDWARFDPYKK